MMIGASAQLLRQRTRPFEAGASLKTVPRRSHQTEGNGAQKSPKTQNDQTMM